MTKKLSLYFIRHGQTYLNKYGRMQGWSDAPLTPEDWKMLKQVEEDSAMLSLLQPIQATYKEQLRLQMQC